MLVTIIGKQEKYDLPIIEKMPNVGDYH